MWEYTLKGRMIVKTNKTMDYKKAYEDALERAKKSLETAKTFDYKDEKIARDIRETVYSIFPELKDSDDKQSKEWILEYLYDGLRKSDEQFKEQFKTAITCLKKHWIESKDAIELELKEKPTKDQVWDYCNKISSEWWQITMDKWETLSDEEKSKYNQFIGFNDFSDMLMNITAGALFQLRDTGKLEYEEGSLLLEKPDEKTYPILSNSSNIGKNEQKTTDKGEPKFKIGDWIAAAVYTWRVTGIKRLDYILQSQNGDTVDDTISYVDEQFHLWSIQDARDGDVLVCDDNKTPFIFKGLLDHHHPNCPVAYCGIDNENEFIVSSGISWWDDCKVEPATREQRELLFSKMKEAGYEWNADKKTLVMIGIDNDEEDERYEELIEDDEISIKQNPAWSKEDEEMLNGCLIDLRFLVDNGRKCNKKLYQNEIKWLEGIKDRVQPQQKQEWGKSDKYMLEAVIDVFFNNTMSGSKGSEVYSKEIDWLKSLKDRVQLHWKPTNQQMNALKRTSEDDYVRYNTILKLLYNDLKKL